MLVLSRNRNERIFVGPDITVTIVRIGPNSVRIGIDAPAELLIQREEIRDVPAGAETSPAPEPQPVS